MTSLCPRQYFTGQFDNTYCCLLFTVSCVNKEFSIFLYVTIFVLIPSIGNGEFLLNINYKSDFCVWQPIANYKIMSKFKISNPQILKCAVIPKTVIGKLSAVFNFVVVGCIRFLKQSSIC